MKPGFWLHIVHLANADLLQDIKQAQDEGLSWLSIYSSDCCPSIPHLLFASDQSQLLLLPLTNCSQHASRHMVFQPSSPSPLLLLPLVKASELFGQAALPSMHLHCTSVMYRVCPCISGGAHDIDSSLSAYKLYSTIANILSHAGIIATVSCLEQWLLLRSKSSCCCCSCRPASQRGNCSPLHWLQ